MHVHGLHHARTYPAATQKGVADLCLCQLVTMYVQMHVHKIFSLRIDHMQLEF